MCKKRSRSLTVLVADDDADDRLLIRDAFQECQSQALLQFAIDGVDAINYLTRREKYERPEDSPRPGLILLDLNMPRKDGLETLKEIKNNPHLLDIPVVVLTTSNAQEDVCKMYAHGVSSFIVKPNSFDNLVKITQDLLHYWFEIVELPPLHAST